MKTFSHNIKHGICTYIELPSITTDVDALGLACGYLTDIILETVAYIGTAKLNPKDKHYIKSIGRQVAEDKKQQVMLKIVYIRKLSEGNTIIKLLSPTEDSITLRVKRGRRVKIEVY